MAVNRVKFHFDNVYWNMNTKLRSYFLFQVGEISCEPSYLVERHRQEVYEITYVISGRGDFIINDKKYPMEKGALFINCIGDFHEIRSSESEPLRYYYLGFTFTEPIDEPYLQLKDFFEHQQERMIFNSSWIHELFIKLLNEISIDDVYFNMLVESYMNTIICTTFRLFSQKNYHNCLTSKETNPDRTLVYDIVSYIDSQVEKIDSLKKLSEEFGYSYTHIAQKFSSVMGESLKSYFTHRRFERAQEYLQEGLTITAISEILNYKSIHAFSRAFHKQIGMSAREYQQWIKESRAITHSDLIKNETLEERTEIE